MPTSVHPCPWQPSLPCLQQQSEPPRQSAHVQSQSVLAAEVELLRTELRGCLARVESYLMRAEAALCKPLVEHDVSSSSKLHVGSAVDGKANLYGCFSPRARLYLSQELVVSAASESEDIGEGMTPVMLILPELRELCREPAPSQPMVQPEMGSLGSSEVASTLPPLEPNQRGGLSDDVFLSPKSIGQVIPVGDKAALSSALSSVPGALFAKKFCEFLTNLEASSPGSGKTIGVLLKEKEIRDKGKKMGANHLSGILKEKSFKGKSKKSGVTRKAFVAA